MALSCMTLSRTALSAMRGASHPIRAARQATRRTLLAKISEKLYQINLLQPSYRNPPWPAATRSNASAARSSLVAPSPPRGQERQLQQKRSPSPSLIRIHCHCETFFVLSSNKTRFRVTYMIQNLLVLRESTYESAKPDNFSSNYISSQEDVSQIGTGQSRPGSSWDSNVASAAATKPSTAVAGETRTLSHGSTGKNETESYTTSTVSSTTSGSEEEEEDFEVEQKHPVPLTAQVQEKHGAKSRVDTSQSSESQPNQDVLLWDLTDVSDDVSIEIKSVEEVSEVSTLSIRSAASLEDVSDIVEADLESRSQAASFLSPMRVLALRQQADSLYDNACDLHRQGKLNEALKLLKMSSDHAKDACENTLEARSLARMGLIYNRANRQQKAIMCFRYAIKLIADRTDNTKITALQGLARAHRILGQYDIASAFEYQAMEVLRDCWQAIRERQESFSLSILIDAEDSKSPPKTFGENSERIEKYIRRELEDAESLISSGGGEETIPILKTALDYAMLLGNLELEGKV
eukprot:747979-Hanusia_phi.AAC.2